MSIGRPFQPRNPGGPGRPKGSRNKLAEAFLEALHADFQAHGAAAIEAARTESPLGYVRVVASLLPQKLEVNRVAGDLHALYGVANLESLSSKRQRVLPAKCRVYDLINFASEVATHKAPASGRGRLQAYIGTLISDEYDLEGTAEKVPEFADLFLNMN